MASDPTQVTRLYEQIPLQAMQQVSQSYMAWYVDRVTGELDKTIAELRTELRENDTKEASYRPSPNELGAIERLQRSGVTGMDLLDRMVEQGEDWLMLTMRRLDHFEKTGLAPKDYSTWCEHALGGAYDWIDHERINTAGSGAPAARPAATSQPSQSGGGQVPDWLAGRNQGARTEDGPTAPVPSVGGGSYGNGYQQAQNGAQGGQDDDGKGRNIFRIFTN